MLYIGAVSSHQFLIDHHYWNEGLPYPNSKLGGFGSYVEHDARGTCAQCGTANHLVFQLGEDSKELKATGSKLNGFDMAYAFLLQCPQHPEQMVLKMDGCLRV